MLDQAQIEQLILSKLELLEQERMATCQVIKNHLLRVRWLVVLSVVTVIAVCIIAALCDLLEVTGLLLFIGVIVVGSSIVRFNRVTKRNNTKLRARFKQKVQIAIYKEIIQAWNSTAQYYSGGYVVQAHYQSAHLFNAFNRYRGDHHFMGTLADGRPFEFSELNVWLENREYDEGPDPIPVFKGLFFVLDHTLPIKDFEGSLMIKPKTPTSKRPPRQPTKPKRRMLPPDDNNSLDVGDSSNEEQSETTPMGPERSLFEQLYEIIPDTTAARAQLSDKLCDSLVKMHTQHYQNVSLRFRNDDFINNRVYMACQHNLEFWPVELEVPMLSQARVQPVARSFAVAFKLLEMLVQNTHVTLPSTV